MQSYIANHLGTGGLPVGTAKWEIIFDDPLAERFMNNQRVVVESFGLRECVEISLCQIFKGLEGALLLVVEFPCWLLKSRKGKLNLESK